MICTAASTGKYTYKNHAYKHKKTHLDIKYLQRSRPINITNVDNDGVHWDDYINNKNNINDNISMKI